MAKIILKPENDMSELLYYQDNHLSDFFILQKQDIYKDIVLMSLTDDLQLAVNRPFSYNIGLQHGVFDGEIVIMLRYRPKRKNKEIIEKVVNKLNALTLISNNNDDDILVIFWNNIADLLEWKKSTDFSILSKYMYNPLMIMYKRILSLKNIEKQSEDVQQAEYKKIKIKA